MTENFSNFYTVWILPWGVDGLGMVVDLGLILLFFFVGALGNKSNSINLAVFGSDCLTLAPVLAVLLGIFVGGGVGRRWDLSGSWGSEVELAFLLSGTLKANFF